MRNYIIVVSKTANDITNKIGNDGSSAGAVNTNKIGSDDSQPRVVITGDSKPDHSRRNQIAVLGIHVSNLALDLFVSVFLAAKILEVTNGNIGSVGLFNLIYYAAIFITFLLSSYIIKRVSRVWAVRVSILLTCSSILLILVLQGQLEKFYLMLAGVWGAAQGVYWASMHTFTTEALGGKKMAGYVIWYTALSSLTRVIFPFTLGAVIQYANKGFGVAVLVMLCISVVLLAFTFVMREQRKNGTVGLSMRKFFRHLRKEGHTRRTWSQFFIQMLFPLQSIVTVCITILIVLEFRNNFSLGALTSVFSGVAVLTITFYRIVKSQRIKTIVFFAASFIPLGCAAALLFSVSRTTIILCQAGFVGFRVVSGSELEKTRMNLMSDIDAEHLHTEGLLFIEFAYFLARMAACALIISAASFGAFFFQVLVVVLIATVPLSAMLIYLWTRKYTNKLIQ